MTDTRDPRLSPTGSTPMHELQASHVYHIYTYTPFYQYATHEIHQPQHDTTYTIPQNITYHIPHAIYTYHSHATLYIPHTNPHITVFTHPHKPCMLTHTYHTPTQDMDTHQTHHTVYATRTTHFPPITHLLPSLFLPSMTLHMSPPGLSVTSAA